MITATYMDKDVWSKTGANWVRHAKLAGLKGFVIGKDLPEQAEQKAQELGFRVFPLIEKFGDDRDQLHTLVKNLDKHDRCLFVKSSVFPKGLFESGADICCGLERANAVDIVSSVRNLYQRAKAAKLIQQHGENILSPKWILGTWDFWNSFAAFQNYLYEEKYMDKYSTYYELIFNLYMSIFKSFSLEISHD